MSEPQTRVLIVDDQFLIAELWSIHVENMGLTVCGRAATAEQAIDLAQKHRPAIVLMDLRLQGEKDGVDAAIVIHELVGSKIIFVTGSKEPKTVTRIQLGYPTAVLFKPVSDRDLQAAIRNALPQ
jgi:DNA-binding NarL/FixJ family response regulator